MLVGLMLVLMLMWMLVSYASVDFFALSFVLSCAYAYVTSEDQALSSYQGCQIACIN